MALTTLREILIPAISQSIAVGAFNVANYETALAVIHAAESEKSPVIIQVYSRLFNSGKASDLAGMLLRLAGRCNQPVALHLDHGENLRQVDTALKSGYTSVMLDASRMNFQENTALTSQAVQMAHNAGASAEGEIGHVAQGDETALTSTEEAAGFAKATGVDALAISIGTAHGYYKARPELDIARCREIAEACPGLPLVLHGGSATPPDQLRAAIQAGIVKINIATEFMDTYLKTARRELNRLDGAFVPLDKFYDPIVDECAAHAARLIRLFRGE